MGQTPGAKKQALHSEGDTLTSAKPEAPIIALNTQNEDSKQHEITFAVEGIHCASCIYAIESALAQEKQNLETLKNQQQTTENKEKEGPLKRFGNWVKNHMLEMIGGAVIGIAAVFALAPKRDIEADKRSVLNKPATTVLEKLDPKNEKNWAEPTVRVATGGIFAGVSMAAIAIIKNVVKGNDQEQSRG